MNQFSLSEQDMLQIVENGLPPTDQPKKILILGAGIAGLVAGMLLKKAGHSITILEASKRIGGRIYTMREPFLHQQYLEAGAMRIPATHRLTCEYIKKFQLPTYPFINSTPQDRIFVNGIRTDRQAYEHNPDLLQYPVTKREQGKTAAQLFNEATYMIQQWMQQPELENQLIEKFGNYSTDRFLRKNPIGPSLSSGALEMVKVILDVEGYSELSLLETIKDYLIFEHSSFFAIEGGNDRLPKSFFPYLAEDILFHQKVTGITQSTQEVVVRSMDVHTQEQHFFTGDLLLITIPYSVLNFVEIPVKDISHQKRMIIRELHYLPASKIGLQFNNRFWEQQGQFAGQTITDLPIRFSYFPSTHFGSDQGGIILASYAWEDDATLWDSLSLEEKIFQALRQLAFIYGDVVYQHFLTGASMSWLLNPWSAGASAFYKPGNAKEFNPYIATPEGRFYFAGEHTSSLKGWIEGAIQSAIRAAYEIWSRCD